MYIIHFPARNYSGGVLYEPYNDTGSGGMGMPAGMGFPLVGNSSSSTSGEELQCGDQYQQCFLTSEPGYIVYSALGSFYIPMCIMAFFYWKIYRAAVGNNKAIKRGMIVTKTGGDFNSSTPERSVTLRVHRGGSASAKSYSSTALYNGSRSSFREPAFTTVLEREVSGSTTTNGVTRSSSGTGLSQYHKAKSRDKNDSNWRRTHSARVKLEQTDPHASSPLLGKNKRRNHHCQPQQIPLRSNMSNKRNKLQSTDTPVVKSVIFEDSPTIMSTTSLSDSVVDNNKETTLLKKLGKHNLKNHIRRINKEKKAAKTVGIIVGCFILCWFPFFTCYLLGAFCDDCTPPLVFSIFFWLGYCNSAINPCVYALFSKDFR